MPLKKISLLLFLLIACACAVSLSQLTWKVVALSINQPLNTPTVSDTLESTSDTTSLLSSTVSAIKKQSLFGQAIAADQPVQVLPAAKDIKQTQLNIQLLGLVHGTHSVAVINYEGKQGAYLAGEVFSKKGSREVSLASIETDHVIIYNNGAPEKLLLPKEKVSSRAMEPASTASTQAVQDKTVDLSSTRYRRLLGNNPKQTLMTNPLSLSKYMMLSPANEQGRLKGYRISPGPDKRLLAQSGIQAGDLITHIDNNPVSSFDITSLYQLLQSANTISLTLERDGQPINMDIKL